MMDSALNNTSFAAQLQCAASETDSTTLKVIKTVLYSLIMVAALLGNLFIIIIVYKKKNMRRTTNIFIANMAASDIFIAAVVSPRILIELYIGPRLWLIDGIFGSFLCKLCFFFTDFSVSISIISHAVIAVDRFWAIVYSLRPSLFTRSRRKYIIAFIWLYSFLFHSPNLYAHRLQERNGANFCMLDWSPLDNKTSKKTFFGVIFIMVICIPVILMTVLYSWLVISLNSKKSFSSQTSEVRKQRRKEDIRVLIKVVAMVIMFLCCLIPITVLALLMYYAWDGNLVCSAWGYAFVAHMLFVSNSAINPWLCICIHESYRRHIRKMFSSWRYLSTESQRHRNQTFSESCERTKIHSIINTNQMRLKSNDANRKLLLHCDNAVVKESCL
ncbi:QRFP-like peptide receptor [Actinia tenebrosa]|uniref:QRFP-like peptide receptor n=1 Tax=Actinia tenebrosa TaxID=6105 RepID=A0A6P8IK65_ACTTE|nr:QRFP-like peptide receptor [Actinia tenebrosa]XP_031566827.1 QRFP-like peptide receptor [Actinia tenebrosa]XP_031566828.1 QRFP-like peptide receptor [Actinia tenebrosa]XP_031566830.1 QRFP-like peptide receptor [Actinia tenebrosa]XP_031566831.1 QRFP-like peptide receptor [Actinia tenebrosa]XP_031566832.1 QRFP-like peptide receptor [Actinia tenebrosa]XP_031566833.1 QRFP-like peptide receptor [Actinia tenebrosa]